MRLPHIVLIIADDLGWGDARCYNAGSAIPTPRIDRIADGGCRFTDVHAPGAVCTPSRFGLMTGQYYWRLGLDRPGLDGYDADIVQTRTTVASLLQGRGYHTACVGKWHLGLGTERPTDFSRPFHPCPVDHGFDSFYGLASSLDMPPYCYIENDRALPRPTEGIVGTPHGTPGFYRSGAIAPGFKHEEVLPTLTGKAVEAIDTHTAAHPERPLFLYFALNGPHTPWLPVPHARGKSGAGRYGDFVWQVDDAIGQVTEALEQNRMAGDTLLIVTSDHGGLQSWIPEEYGHRCNGPWRGQKGDAWEGGHRIPFIVRWPGHIEADSTNDALMSLTDMLATFAAVVDVTLPGGVGEDSLNQLPVWLGECPAVRDDLVIDSVRGLHVVRKGNWKLIDGSGSGGLRWKAEEHQPKAGEPEGQLYNLADDPGETHNRWAEMPEKVGEMLEAMRTARRA